MRTLMVVVLVVAWGCSSAPAPPESTPDVWMHGIPGLRDGSAVRVDGALSDQDAGDGAADAGAE